MCTWHKENGLTEERTSGNCCTGKKMRHQREIRWDMFPYIRLTKILLEIGVDKMNMFWKRNLTGVVSKFRASAPTRQVTKADHVGHVSGDRSYVTWRRKPYISMATKHVTMATGTVTMTTTSWLVTKGEAKMADPPVAMATGGRSPLEFIKLLHNLKILFKNSIRLLRYLTVTKKFSITRNRNFIFQNPYISVTEQLKELI